MYCPYCGVKNDRGEAECFICGKKLPAGGDQEAPSSGGPRRPGVSTAQRGGAVPVPARLGDRFIAIILDTLFLSALILVIAALVSLRWSMVQDLGLSQPMLIALAASTAVLIVFLYHWLLEGAFGATMGKAIVGVRVLNQRGGVPGLRSSAVRNVIRLFEAVPLYLPGFFVAVFSPARRRIGDYAAHTIVLEQPPTLGSRITIVCIWFVLIAAAVWGAYLIRPEWFQFGLRPWPRYS
jgi:uncharacterized RDD family membrane protein YckC